MSNGFLAVDVNQFSTAECEEVVHGVLNSPYYGKSVLGMEFVRTHGFSIVFRREAMEGVAEAFPFLKRLLDTVLFTSCNAFYINPLVLQNSSRVEAHIDCRAVSIQSSDGCREMRIIPNLVSVFYAEVDSAMRGGKLILNVGRANEFSVSPRAGNVVHFLGSVIHAVEAVTSPHRRVSVVCEQYHLGDEALAGFPFCDVLTEGVGDVRLNAMKIEGAATAS